LRYWEQEFPQLKPVKRRGNRRYYQREDVEMIRTIRSLLYEQGYTIGGARQRMSDEQEALTPAEVQTMARECIAELMKAQTVLAIEE
jgi:DNA-binding transcriptional MerR regulator